MSYTKCMITIALFMVMTIVIAENCSKEEYEYITRDSYCADTDVMNGYNCK